MMTAMLTVENIKAGARIYDIWQVNEDAEYHEAGDEGERAGVTPTRDQAAALSSLREVPHKIAAEKCAEDRAAA